MYQLIFSEAAQKDIDKKDKRYKPRIFAALFDLRKEPYLGKKLMGKFKEFSRCAWVFTGLSLRYTRSN